MKKIDFSTVKYDAQEDVKKLIENLEMSLSKFSKNIDQYNSCIKKLDDSIEKKKVAIGKLNDSALELSKKMEEFDALKTNAKREINELEDKKNKISYVDKEVQKMETDDIDTLINAKTVKIDKIDAKVLSTKEKIETNNTLLHTAEAELDSLVDDKINAEDNLSKTEAIVKLLNNISDDICVNIEEIINSEYVVISEEAPSLEEERVEEKTVEVVDSKDEEIIVSRDIEDDLLNIDFSEYGLTDITPVEVTQTESSINEDEINKPVETEEPFVPLVDYKALLEDIFDKETISFADFAPEIQERMMENADKVIKIVIVLKKHQIPLELTLKQPEIYFGIDAQDLDDLFNIITADENGNGMGYTKDYVYYILNELSKIDVDKLIDVYNNEFMNISPKSGLISLLKMSNADLGAFEDNKLANINILKSLGVVTAEQIALEYQEFINIDNPLFLSVLDMFDKDDLVNKMNNDISVIGKIYEYWKNN